MLDPQNLAEYQNQYVQIVLPIALLPYRHLHTGLWMVLLVCLVASVHLEDHEQQF